MDVMPSLVDPVLPPGSLGRREQPVLEAGGLLLRPWGPADYSALLAATPTLTFNGGTHGR